jgi:hypothetical protein
MPISTALGPHGSDSWGSPEEQPCRAPDTRNSGLERGYSGLTVENFRRRGAVPGALEHVNDRPPSAGVGGGFCRRPSSFALNPRNPGYREFGSARHEAIQDHGSPARSPIPARVRAPEARCPDTALRPNGQICRPFPRPVRCRLASSSAPKFNRYEAIPAAEISIRQHDGRRALAKCPSSSPLTARPDTVLSECWGMRHTKFQHKSRRHPNAAG